MNGWSKDPGPYGIPYNPAGPNGRINHVFIGRSIILGHTRQTWALQGRQWGRFDPSSEGHFGDNESPETPICAVI